jgi:hypothetical protein
MRTEQEKVRTGRFGEYTNLGRQSKGRNQRRCRSNMTMTRSPFRKRGKKAQHFPTSQHAILSDDIYAAWSDNDEYEW